MRKVNFWSKLIIANVKFECVHSDDNAVVQYSSAKQKYFWNYEFWKFWKIVFLSIKDFRIKWQKIDPLSLDHIGSTHLVVRTHHKFRNLKFLAPK